MLYIYSYPNVLLYVIFTQRRNNYRIRNHDPDPNLQIILGPSGSGSTALPLYCRLYLKLINTVYDRFCDIKCFPTKEE
jgi:hypothetical protein